MATDRRENARISTSPLLAADRRLWITVVILCIGQLMLTLDATVANVALPAIQRDLKFSQSSLAWVVNGYLITFGGALLLAGRLGDLLGPQERLPRRPGALHVCLAAVWACQLAGVANRRSRPARGGCGW